MNGVGPAAPAPQQPHQPPYQPRKTSAMAIIALVLSCLIFLPLIPFIGSILGIIALVRLSDRPDLGGKGLAIAAIPVGLVVVLFLQGMMAAIAIPAFIKYVRKSKTIEATESLDKLTIGVRSYAQADRYDAGGNLLPKEFPQGDTGWVPATPCCQGPTGPKCSPSPSHWQGSPWKDLHFSLADPHYFQYRYHGAGRTYVVEARADLDCDGTFSNYRMLGSLSDEGEVETRGPIIQNEIE